MKIERIISSEDLLTAILDSVLLELEHIEAPKWKARLISHNRTDFQMFMDLKIKITHCSGSPTWIIYFDSQETMVLQVIDHEHWAKATRLGIPATRRFEIADPHCHSNIVKAIQLIVSSLAFNAVP